MIVFFCWFETRVWEFDSGYILKLDLLLLGDEKYVYLKINLKFDSYYGYKNKRKQPHQAAPNCLFVFVSERWHGGTAPDYIPLCSYLTVDSSTPASQKEASTTVSTCHPNHNTCTVLKIRNMYSQKWNCGDSFPIYTAIYIFQWLAFIGIIIFLKSMRDTLCSTAGTERRAGNCCQANRDWRQFRALPSAPVVQQRVHINDKHTNFQFGKVWIIKGNVQSL